MIILGISIEIISKCFGDRNFDYRPSVWNRTCGPAIPVQQSNQLSCSRISMPQVQWTIPQLTKILNSTSLDKNFITAWKSITKLVIFQSFDFCCDFLLLEDVKEWMSYKCSTLWNLIATSLSNPLLRVLQKEKIATKIGRVNRPYQF
jgi:hypothetical protein